jgi:hypothetical protein
MDYDNIFYVFVIIFIIIITHYFYNEASKETYVISSLDGEYYRVLEKFEDKDEAADIMAEINRRINVLIDYMYDKYKDQPDSHQFTLVMRIKRRYNVNNLFENDPPDPQNTSFVTDKGAEFAVCIREKDTGDEDFHDINIISFVVVHELSHIASVEFGHESEFWDNFQCLLIEASECGIYDPVNYKENPINYCSLWVDYNPLFDN